MESVPQLLSGLKLAFLSSIAGMIASIILRTFPIFYLIKIPKVDKKAEEDNVGFIINSLKSIESNQREFNTNGIELIKKIEVALCGDGDMTLLTQIQKLRITFADKQDEMLIAFREFAENVAKDGTKAIVEALEKVTVISWTRVYSLN